MTEITAKTPWAGHTGDVPLHLDYFDGSMFEALELVAKKYPRNIAFDFMGKPTTYPQMIEEIKKCARSLKTIGVREGDKVTIAMPNCPQAIYMFYAVNLVGGIANMIHPLSAEKEIEFYLNASESVAAVTLDQFYNKFEKVRERTKEIGIMKLVGATNGFIRFPFFVEGVTSGLISAGIASGIVCGAYYALCRWYAENPSNLSQMFGGTLVPLESVWYYIVGGFVLLGFVLCGLGTATSIRKHLNV
mgnify:CR=1 FL=1